MTFIKLVLAIIIGLWAFLVLASWGQSIEQRRAKRRLQQDDPFPTFKAWARWLGQLRSK